MKIVSACAVLLAAIAGGCFSGYSDDSPSTELRVRRGSFASDMVLSGELEAAQGDFLAVPALPSWQTAIKWLAEEGTSVKAGEVVVELDNGSLTADLETKRQTATQAIQELQQKDAEWAADLEQKQLDVEKARSDMEKARIDTLLPRELVSTRQYEDKQNALRRTTTAYEKTLDLLASRRAGVAAERENLILRINKAEREIAVAEKAITALVLRAPRDGIVVVRDHMWEGRKLQTGDPVWVGFPIAMLPDLTTLRVKAALPDVDDGKIAVGMPVTITMDGYPAFPFTGRIEAISAIAQESQRQSLRRQFDAIVAIDKLDPARMRPGLSARIVVQREARAAVLLAPRAAIDFTGAVPRARLAAGGTKDVKLGSCNAQDCIVRGGLEDGERLAPVVEVRRG